MPGEPGKSEAIRYELSSPDYAEWLNEVFNSLNLTKTSLLGLSLGGWMSLKFSTAYPERVEKLVLLCPAGVSPQKTSFTLFMLPFMFMGQWGLRQIIKRINGKEIVPDEVINFSILVSRNFNPVISIPLFSDEDLKKLTMPVFLMVGDKDVMLYSTITIKRLTKLVPFLTANMLPDTGHLIINKTKQIIEFLTKVYAAK
ncbi:MAG: alpha/beta hydrolase [Actinobacteria bacterium]|nr:alpha/beta hydrolase [Actinomycetota bacterium]